jgi:hypothetical protein
MRLLRPYETELIKALLMADFSLAELIIPTLDTILVEEADDGGMGGLIFKSNINNVDRSVGRTVAETEFLDEDMVPVSVELSLDKNSQLFELDVWKIDYSPVSRWPNISQIVIK